MPGVRGSADAVGEVDGGVLFVGLPLATLAPAAANEGEDPGGPGRPDSELPGVRRELDSRGGTSRLGTVLLSPLPLRPRSRPPGLPRPLVTAQYRAHDAGDLPGGQGPPP